VNLQITAKDFPLTPSIKQYVAERVAHLTHRAPDILSVRVELDVDHNQHSGVTARSEVWVHLPGTVVSAGAKAESVRAALDLTVPKIARQIRDRKGRRLARRHGHHARRSQALRV
jgi:ribosomal subunit interface protein